jgi:hypothetical protein
MTSKCNRSAIVLATLFTFGGCTPAAPPATTNTDAEPLPAAAAEVEGFAESGNQTQLAPILLAPYTVKALHIGEVTKGHFNLYVEGGELAAIRAWVGDESANQVMVTKAEFEVDHHCAHIEVPQPLPATARLWVEIETMEGVRLKGSTEIQ